MWADRNKRCEKRPGATRVYVCVREWEFLQGERWTRCLKTNHSHLRLNWRRHQTEKMDGDSGNEERECYLSQQQAHKFVSCPISPPPYAHVLIHPSHVSFSFSHTRYNLTLPGLLRVKSIYFCRASALRLKCISERMTGLKAKRHRVRTPSVSKAHSPFWRRALEGCRWCRWRWWEPSPCWRGRSSGCPPCLWPARSACTETLSANVKKLCKSSANVSGTYDCTKMYIAFLFNK